MPSKHRTGPARPPTQPAPPRRSCLALLSLRAKVAYVFAVTGLIAAGATLLTYALYANGLWIVAALAAGAGAALFVAVREHAFAWASAYRSFRAEIVAHNDAIAASTAQTTQLPAVGQVPAFAQLSSARGWR